MGEKHEKGNTPTNALDANYNTVQQWFSKAFLDLAVELIESGYILRGVCMMRRR